MQARGGAVRGVAREQEETQARKIDRTAHPHEKQTLTRRPRQKERAIRGHCQVSELKTGRRNLREVGSPGRVQQNGERHQALQREYCQVRTRN